MALRKLSQDRIRITANDDSTDQTQAQAATQRRIKYKTQAAAAPHHHQTVCQNVLSNLFQKI